MCRPPATDGPSWSGCSRSSSFPAACRPPVAFRPLLHSVGGSFLPPSVKHYDFARRFRALYDHAAVRFASGKRGADSFCTPDETAFLAASGLTAQHLYDYAEDHNNYGEPGPDNALAIECVRRDY